MFKDIGKKVAVMVLIVGLASVAIGGFFVQQGFAKANYIHQEMEQQKVVYGSADSEVKINGVVDTKGEAQLMADLLEQHRIERYGYYTDLERNDPNRDQILKALTMENSLHLAVAGYGLTDVVKGTGAFMILVGMTFGAISVVSLRKREQTPEQVQS